MIEPVNEAELVDVIASTAASGRKLLVQGGGSKCQVGRPVDAGILSVARIRGVVDYDPSELVLTLRPGTPLSEVQALVAEQRQMLAFEPFDHGPIFGRAAGQATIGGIIGAGVSGSRRVSAGGARDHILGMRAVSGRGEAFVAGAKVVKNVTGYDLPKLAAGSWGRLFALTEISLKTLPKPQVCRSLALPGLSPVDATRAMSRAMGSPAQVAAAAHLPGDQDLEESMTVFRLEGFGPSVAARADQLVDILSQHAPVQRLKEHPAQLFWTRMQTLALLPSEHPLWRVNIPPRNLPGVASTIERLGGSWLADWAGALVWTACDLGVQLREAVHNAGGHAMLIRGPRLLRSQLPAFHPQPRGVALLEERVRHAFDPCGVFETGRF